MSTGTGISYLDATWNPTTGCSPISVGCSRCWAKRMATRLRGRAGYPADNPFKPTCHPGRLDIPLHWKKPRRIGVSFMGDLFHPSISFEFILDVLYATQQSPQHAYLILTKRPQSILDFIEWFNMPISSGDNPKAIQFGELENNLYIGVSVENQQAADERIPILLQIPAAMYWVSYEPALGPLVLPPDFLKLGKRARVVCGGETGRGARPMHPDWPRRVRDDCVAAGVPFWFKSWGEWAGYEIYENMDRIQAINISYIDKEGKTYEKYHEIMGIKGIAYIARVGKKESGNRLDGKIWEQLP